MSDSNDKINAAEDDLDDLDSLLDELEDDILSKPPGSQAGEKIIDEPGAIPEPKAATAAATATAIPDGPSSGPSPGQDQDQGEVEQQFDSLMEDIALKDPTLASKLTEFVKELQKEEDITNPKPKPNPTVPTSTTQNKNFEEIMSDTINRLKTSGADVDKQLKEEQNGGGSGEGMDPIAQLLKQLESMGGLDDDGNDENGDFGIDGDGAEDGFGSMLMDMLSQLTSKSVLYEPLKDLHTKFPAWLSENKDNVNETEYKNYQDQYHVIDEIITKFEDVGYEDKKDSKYINLKLEILQNLGMPPAEIMNSDLGALPGFNSGSSAEAGGAGAGLNETDMEKQLEETCNQT